MTSRERQASWNLSTVLPPQFLVASYQGCELGGLGGHALRVAAYTYAVAQHYGLAEAVCERLRQAAAFHDIGKMLLPEWLFSKPGQLSPQERRQVESHTLLGHDLLSKSSLPTLRDAATLALHHHERIDGSGYPHRLVGETVPLGARIVSVADVFDALTSQRSYRSALSEADALEFICRRRGSKFDAKAVDALLAALESYPDLGRRIRWFTQTDTSGFDTHSGHATLHDAEAITSGGVTSQPDLPTWVTTWREDQEPLWPGFAPS